MSPISSSTPLASKSKKLIDDKIDFFNTSAIPKIFEAPDTIHVEKEKPKTTFSVAAEDLTDNKEAPSSYGAKDLIKNNEAPYVATQVGPFIKIPIRKVKQSSCTEPFNETDKGKSNPEKSLEQKIRADLNKLCPENYATVVERIKSYEFPKNVEKYKAIIVLIFERVLDDERLSAVYGDLCSDLSTHNKEVIKKACQAKGKDPNDKEYIKELGIPNFRDTLLRSVQELYEKFWTEGIKTTDVEKSVDKAKDGLKPILDEMEAYKQVKRKKQKCPIGTNPFYNDEEVMNKLETDEYWKKLMDKKKLEEAEIRYCEEELIERRNKSKKRIFSNVKFIGELFKRGLIVEKIIHKCCIEPLLANPDDDKIEALKVLLELVGQQLEQRYLDRKMMRKINQQGDDNRESNLMEEYFSKIKEIRINFEHYGLHVKSHYFLLELEDLKNANWDNKKRSRLGDYNSREDPRGAEPKSISAEDPSDLAEIQKPLSQSIKDRFSVIKNSLFSNS